MAVARIPTPNKIHRFSPVSTLPISALLFGIYGSLAGVFNIMISCRYRMPTDGWLGMTGIFLGEIRARIKTSPSSRGIALVVVLAFLVLIAGIVLACHHATHLFQERCRCRQHPATCRLRRQYYDGADRGCHGDQRRCKPCVGLPAGMIRTFDTGGAPTNYYKLYFSNQMVIPRSGFSVASEAPPSDWNSATNAGL